MLRTLHRLLPAPDTRILVGLTVWLTAAAVLHGVALGVAGILTAACLGAVADPAFWMIALACTVVAFVIVQWVAQMVAFRVGSSTARALHLSLGEHLAELPLGWFTSTRQAHIIDLATTGVPQAMSYPAILLRPALTAIVTPVAAALTLALLDWRFTVAVLVITAIAWTASRLSARLARTVDARRHAVSAEATRRILEYANRQPLIRTDQRPEDSDALDRALDGVHAAARRSAGTVIPGFVLFSLTLNALFAVLIGLGVLWVAGASLSVPVLLGLLVVAARLVAVAQSGAELAAGLRLQAGILDRLAATLDTPPLAHLPAVQRAKPGEELVRVENITFGYDDTPVLHDVSFTLPRRGLTALVGPSGSGKTTLARLLARFWDPTAGRIILDGADLRSLAPGELTGALAVVLQDDYLLEGTIGDNIRLGRPTSTAKQVAETVAAVGLDAFLAGLPGALDTPVGPGGSRLSGGQRQRVCVARALLKAAPLTLMDEATSALDPENARLVADAATRLALTGSVLIIAHDLDTAARADQILVLEEGRIVQSGTPAALAAAPGRYRDLLHDHAGLQS
ncbi:ABC transporter ATP-binding protein [Microbacterium marinilacus]|uniref:ABC transporter ATP-binding protein n=1 Tax=Microbacterium marinilacus TaxID=415209 RepID=A0ABP7BJB7_9MICO|nr:ABC transporter ATP-binding protein [Microbacterium marinilacus]MBY0687590.1 ABC transporter ATP-binding protein/permease [Microbacterium marinilacus]